jgi:chromosome segregation ATPase
MALSHKARSEAYEGLRSIMSEQSADDLLAHFPARDLDEPVTREFLRAELADVRSEIAELDARLSTQLAEVDNRLSTHLAEVDKRLSTHLAEVDKRLSTQLAEVDKRLSTQIALLPNEIATRYTRQTATVLAAITVATAILRFS